MAAKKKVGAKAAAKAPGKVVVPLGSYDPGLDAQLRASQRGLTDLIGTGTSPDTYGGDIGQALQRGASDYALTNQQTNEDYSKSLGDLLTARQNATQDYGTNTQTLQRNYQNLGTSQMGADRKAGAFAGSGAQLQAARKRTVNQATDQAPIDLAYNRYLADNTEQQTGLATTRDRALGQAGLTYGRSTEDLGTQAERASREALAFGGDVQAAKVAQFFQNVPDQKLPTVASLTTIAKPAASPGGLLAAPGAPGVKKVRKGNKLTYTAQVGGP